MEFTINRNHLLEQLTMVSKAVSPHSPLPSLSGIFMNVLSDRIELTGSDNRLTILTSIVPNEKNMLTIQETGGVVIEARYLLEILRKMSGTSIKVETMDQSLVRVTNSTGQCNLWIRPASDYPAIDISQPSQQITVDSSLIRDIASQVGFAASEKDTRLVLMGVNLRAKGGKLYCAATDSYRLARKVVEIPGEEEFSITVPVKSINDLVSIMNSGEENLNVYIDKRKIQFCFGNTMVQSQLLEGKYPDVERIIPTSFTSELQVEAQEIRSLLELAAVYQGETNLVKLICSSQESELQNQDREVGSSKLNMETAEYTGEPVSVSINGKFLLQAVKGLKASDKVTLSFTGPVSPIRITKPGDDSVAMVVVPLRNYN